MSDRDIEALKVVCGSKGHDVACQRMLDTYMQSNAKEQKAHIVCPLECTQTPGVPGEYVFAIWLLLAGCLVYILTTKRF